MVSLKNVIFIDECQIEIFPSNWWYMRLSLNSWFSGKYAAKTVKQSVWEATWEDWKSLIILYNGNLKNISIY